MQSVVHIPDLRAARRNLPGPVGLVPTMGFLHEGHLSLVRRARAECASVVVSIFVNPTQFSPTEDLDAYPRDIPRDMALLKAEKVDLVWSPEVTDMYPEGFQTSVKVHEVSRPLEGAMRSGHFEGVTTVVAKLFNVVQPDSAYFGQKDAQQVAVIRQMVADLDFPLEIVVCPIVREPDGLALSSRNVYLKPAERQAAIVLSRSLTAAAEAFGGGERDADKLRAIMQSRLAAEPLAQVQYVSCADPRSLEELEGQIDQALLSMAVYIGKTRLIDNRLIGD